jgi:hypothetical protein
LAKIVIVLLSAEYLNELYRREMMGVLEQKSKCAHVIPILVRPTVVKGSFLDRLSPLPSIGPAITKWADQDEAWVHVVERIEAIVEEVRSASRRLWS